MTRVYRVLRGAYAQNPFDGEGAYRYGGRWSSPGTRVSYASQNESLALLEYFVHLDPADLPEDLLLATADIPDELSRVHIEINRLPRNWRQTPAPPQLTQFGDEFVKKAENAVLIVPSALATSENNWLINPLHSGFQQIMVNKPEPLTYDPRMFGKHTRTRRHS